MTTSTLTVPIVARRGTAMAANVSSVGWYVWSVVVGITLCTAGMYWDICWHLSIGRDSLWTPAHVSIQLGSAVVGFVCAYLILHTTLGRDAAALEAAVRIWGLRGPMGAFISVWGLFLMLAAFPLDNWWHSSFGLDVKLLTPPHFALFSGVFWVGMGSLILLVGRTRLSSGETRKKLNWLLMYVGALLLSLLLMFFMQYLGDQTLMHSSIFYLVLGLLAPPLLVGLNRATSQHWAATKVACIYTALWLAGEWIVPLFPAHARLGPVFTPVTHMIPVGFPVLLVPGALVLDYLCNRFSYRGSSFQALIAASGFLLTMVAVQWPFSILLVSAYARNWIFGTHYFGFMISPSDYHYAWEFLAYDRSRASLWIGIFIAWLATILSTRVGLFWGEWLRRMGR